MEEAQMEESGRKMATRVRTLEPISGILVKYCRMEKMAGRGGLLAGGTNAGGAGCVLCVFHTYLE